MKKSAPFQCLLALGIAALGLAGCATPHVNPPQPRANTGYVDLYADSSGELAWQVEHFAGASQGFQEIFSDFKPVTGRAVRLAFPPGHHRLRVKVLNRFILEPADVEVEVRDGLITPVHVVLVAAETGMMDRKQQQTGATMKGRYGRRTKITSEPEVIFRMTAAAETPVAYQLKENMVYAH